MQREYCKMKNIVCVSQKSVCIEDYFLRVEKIFRAEPFAFILREKELDAEEYGKLALAVRDIARKYSGNLFLNGNFSLACELSLGTQLSFQTYKLLEESPVPVGVSVHSAEEAEYIVVTPKKIPVSHIIAGHIFATDCKKGLEPRGLEFLSDVCRVVGGKYPVFGIGGITPERMPLLYEAGADGGAVMSSCMKEKDVESLFEAFGNCLKK